MSIVWIVADVALNGAIVPLAYTADTQEIDVAFEVYADETAARSRADDLGVACWAEMVRDG